MKPNFKFLALFCPLLLLAAGESYRGKIISVSDGDTYTVLTADKRQVKIRLHGINAPEKNQAYGQRAREYAAGLLLYFRREITVHPHTTDRYGRTIAEIYVDTVNVNRELLLAGMAWRYRQYAPKDRELSAIEHEARAARRGYGAIRTRYRPGNGGRMRKPDGKPGRSGQEPEAGTIPDTVVVNEKKLGDTNAGLVGE